MRKMSIAAAAAAFTALVASTPALAYDEYTICWTANVGATDCVALPRNYRISGVERPRIPDGTVSFRLTRAKIAGLARYVSTKNMLPGQEATVYAPRS